MLLTSIDLMCACFCLWAMSAALCTVWPVSSMVTWLCSYALSCAAVAPGLSVRVRMPFGCSEPIGAVSMGSSELQSTCKMVGCGGGGAGSSDSTSSSSPAASRAASSSPSGMVRCLPLRRCSKRYARMNGALPSSTSALWDSHDRSSSASPQPFHFKPGWNTQTDLSIASAKVLRHNAVPSVWLCLSPGQGAYGGHFEALLTPEQRSSTVPCDQFCSTQITL